MILGSKSFIFAHEKLCSAESDDWSINVGNVYWDWPSSQEEAFLITYNQILYFTLEMLGIELEICM